MANDRTSEACDIFMVDVLRDRRQSVSRRKTDRWENDDWEIVDPWSYLAKRGRGTIRMSSVEWRILQFLASRPYRAFSRRRIAAAVSTRRNPVTAESLGRYIASLRKQLGFFGNYIQSVPHIGYRFKA